MWEFILSLFSKREPAQVIDLNEARRKRANNVVIEDIMSSAKNPSYKITLTEYLKGRAEFKDL